VLLMASGINSLTQRVWMDLGDGGYRVSVSAMAD
jgi:putative two-component system protein, hydrogenase maturation factor HypX/HoxX